MSACLTRCSCVPVLHIADMVFLSLPRPHAYVLVQRHAEAVDQHSKQVLRANDTIDSLRAENANLKSCMAGMRHDDELRRFGRVCVCVCVCVCVLAMACLD
jgi:hypothetical protein